MKKITEKAGLVYSHQNYADYYRVVNAREITKREIEAGHRVIESLEGKIQDKVKREQAFKVLIATEENLALIDVIKELKKLAEIVGAKVKTSIYYSEHINHVMISEKLSSRKYFLDSTSPSDRKYYEKNLREWNNGGDELFEEDLLVRIQQFTRISREMYFYTGDFVAIENKRDIILVDMDTRIDTRHSHWPRLFNEYEMFKIIKHNGEEKALELVGLPEQGKLYKILEPEKLEEVRERQQRFKQEALASLIHV